MKKIVLLLVFTFSFLFGETPIQKENIVKVEKVNINSNELLDDFAVKKLLSDDLISDLLPYEVPFVEFQIPEKNLKECQNIINDYIFNKGYINSSVSCNYNKDNFTLNVSIELKDLLKINNVFFTSDYLKISNNCQRKDICLKKDMVASDENINKLKEVISKELENNGYILNEVSIERIKRENNYVDINFKIKKNILCYFGDISISYEGDIDKELVYNYLRFQKGEIFNYQKIKESIDNLKSKKIFENIIIAPDFNNIKDGVFPVNINLKEKKKHKEIKVGLGYDSYEGIKFSSAWTNYKFLNDYKRLNIDLDMSQKIEDISVNFDNPFIIPEYKINLFNTFEYIKNNTTSNKSQSINNDIYLNRNFNNIKAYIGYKASLINNETEDLIDFNLSNKILVNSLYQKFIIEDLDNPMFPTKGYKFEAMIENSVFSPDFNFLEFNGGVTGYATLSDKYKTYISGKVFFDNIKAEENILNYKKPVAGGYNSNRGYDFQEITESDNTNSIVLTELAVELKQKVYKDIYLFIFDDYTIMNGKDYNSFGFGGYYNSPIGTFSIGNAYNSENEYKIFFNIGVSF